TEGQTDVYEFGPLNSVAADAADAGIKDFRTAKPEQIARFNQLQVARQQREQMSSTDIARTQRAPSESERAQIMSLASTRDDLNHFYQEFPTPESRAPYVGLVRRPVLEVWNKIKEDPGFTAFTDDLANFRRYSDEAKNLYDAQTANTVRGNVPTGYEDGPAQFEKRLDEFNFDVNK